MQQALAQAGQCGFNLGALLSRASIKQPECKSPCSYSTGAPGGLSPPLERSRVQQWRFHKSSAKVKFTPLQISAEGLLGVQCDPSSVFPPPERGPSYSICTGQTIKIINISLSAQWDRGIGVFSLFSGV